MKLDYTNSFVDKIPMFYINIVIGAIVTFFIVLIAGLLLIQQPDNVIGKFNIFSSSFPRTLKAKVDGEVIFIKKNKSQVNKNEDVAFIKTSSDYFQILELEKIITSKNIDIIKNELQSKNFNMLGDIAAPFYDFLHSYEIFSQEKNDNLHLLDERQTKNEIISYKDAYSSQDISVKLEKEQVLIAKQNYESDSILYAKNAITRTTFYNTKSNYLLRKKQLKESIEQLKQLKNRLKSSYTDKAKIGVQQIKKVSVDKTTVEYRLQILRASIKEWKTKYVLSSPCSGQLEYSTFIDNGQIVKSGEEIIKIIPKGHAIKAIIYYPTTNSAGVHVGSSVKLYFDNYDKNSYGYIISKIVSISKIVNTSADGQTFYTGELNIDLSAQKNFEGHIAIDEGMSGQAQIIIKEKNLLTKIINWIDILTSK